MKKFKKDIFAGVRAVVFDFDGTLADTLGAHHKTRLQAFEAIALELGDQRYASVPREIHDDAHNHGSHTREIIGWVLRESGIFGRLDKGMDEAVVGRLVAYKKYFLQKLIADVLPEVEGASDFIRFAHDEFEGNLAIATSAVPSEVHPFLEARGLRKYFDPRLVVTSEDVEATKPAPDVYLETFRRLGITAGSTVLVVEDTPQGIQSANTAGAITVALTTTHNADLFRSLADDQRPSAVVDSFAELVNLLVKPANGEWLGVGLEGDVSGIPESILEVARASGTEVAWFNGQYVEGPTLNDK